MGSKNHRIFPSEEIAEFEQLSGPQGGGSEHDAWVVMGKSGKVVSRRTINGSYGFRFSSPFQYLRRMAEFSAQIPAAAVQFPGISKNARVNGVLIPIDVFFEGLAARPI